VRPVSALKIREYIDEIEKSPYRRWLDELDTTTKARVQARILRVEQENLGDCKNLEDGVWELRLNFGPGYRVYFGFDGKELVILLVGGDKRSQTQDINQAIGFWKIYLGRKGNKNGKKKS
jgi:putative addiction module killer protein